MCNDPQVAEIMADLTKTARTLQGMVETLTAARSEQAFRVHTEGQLREARQIIEVAARAFRSLADGFDQDRNPGKAAGARALAELLEGAL